MNFHKLECLGFALVAVVVATSCSRSSVGKYIPAPEVAHDALSASLEAWRQGESPGVVKTYRVPIQVADSHRKPGQTLKSYQILGEVSEDGGRIFQVRLQLENPDVEEKAQYVVVGIDPLWVFRREDYDMVTHWEHPMPSAGEGPTAAGGPTAAEGQTANEATEGPQKSD